MLTPETPIRAIKGIGEARYEAFCRLGCETASDLLTLFPRTYEERGKVVPISEATDGETCSVEAVVCETAPLRRVREGMTVIRSVVRDDSASMELVFFNSPFMAKTLTPGRRFRIYGRMKHGLYGREMAVPKLEAIYNGRELRNLVPVYRVTPPLTQKSVADAISEAIPLCKTMPDIIPASIREKYGLMQKGDAVRTLHFPPDVQLLAKARKTLAFEELLTFQLALTGMRNILHTEKAHRLTLAGSGMAGFFKSLPFELTNAQKRTIKEVFADLGESVPMARLVQGDVGSGKTVVAAAAMYLCVKNGFQACMMAPTEILARQHRNTLDKFFSSFGIRTALLVSSLPAAEKKEVRSKLENGEIDIVVGTHALITEDTVFKNCAFAVTDEQHRFGVAQRAEILKKSENNGFRAHMLVMSATPIPRSLSLIIYGDLDVSLLDELPAGRKKIETRVVRGDNTDKVYAFVRKEALSGGQAYIVCPMIEESEIYDRKAAESYYETLTRGALAGIPTGLIHGRMKPSEKEKTMAAFVSGELRVLITTTVIEVGVDVPAATVMVIENAECFGLSQLHQLRGRVGRGTRRSVCVLVNGGGGNDAAERLRVMRDTPDGFGIADADLAMRGPGDFFGERQSGDFPFVCASVSDMTMITDTKALVKSICADMGNPEYSQLIHSARKFLERTGGGVTVS